MNMRYETFGDTHVISGKGCRISIVWHRFYLGINGGVSLPHKDVPHWEFWFHLSLGPLELILSNLYRK